MKRDVRSSDCARILQFLTEYIISYTCTRESRTALQKSRFFDSFWREGDNLISFEWFSLKDYDWTCSYL